MVSTVEQLRHKLGVWQAVRVLACARVTAPMVFGLLKPVVLIPAGLVVGLPPAQLKTLLAHELAHIRRWDPAMNLVQALIETLLFYHPAAWWVSRLVREDRERCTDDLVLQVCADRSGYARALASLAGASHLPALATGAASGALVERIRRILGQPASSRPCTRVPLGILVTAALTLLCWAVWGPGAMAAEETVEVAPGGSIQEAIDRAPEGAVVKVPTGTFRENLVIRKPLTLVGQGWDKSVVVAKVAVTTVSDAEMLALQKELQSVANREEARRIWRAKVNRPALEIAGVGKVVVRGLRFGAPAPNKVEGLMPAPLVQCSGARGALIEECAIVGPFWDGIHVVESSAVTIRRSLVAGLWGTGILVEGRRGQSRESEASIEECDVRNCYHRGVTLGPRCDNTVISKSRISGSAWHGVRYDDASPRIEDCAIFSNARSGIYASGRTTAKITGNLFYANEMNGISCWYENRDLIRQNTFAENKREGLTVLGNAQPNVVKNVFYAHPVAVMAGKIGGDKSAALGKPVMEGNILWKNEADCQVASGANAASATNGELRVDPLFRGAGDYALGAESPARKVGAGAASPLSLTSPWHVTEEEKGIIPDGVTRNSEGWRKPGGKGVGRAEAPEASKSAQALVNQAFRIDSREARDEALGAIKALIQSVDPKRQAEGLSALSALRGVEFDATLFRGLIRERLNSPNETVRESALQSLAAVPCEPKDVDLMIGLAGDNSLVVRRRVPGALVVASGRDLTGGAGDAMLRLLSDTDNAVRRNAIHSLWGAKVSSKLDERILQLTRETDDGGEALYFGLSTFLKKSEADVERLIEFLSHRDLINVAGRALWGLGYGIPEKFQPRVAAAVMQLVEARNDPHIRASGLGQLGRYGTAAEIQRLEAMAAKSAISKHDREEVLEAVQAIRSRAALK
jgi:hypothetical protein